ncbi:MAG TPA: Na+/H+ antiporter NhaA [Polyangiales bacterium]|nr:Na+/H+ antiporter NhaA [Polyangiales bacterium]
MSLEGARERVSLTHSDPPEAWQPLRRLVRRARRPLDRFLAIEAASGILLLLSAAAALIWANSPWAHSYHALWQLPLGVRLGAWQLERPLEWLVNDGLMVVFFFVVGMEIRREMHSGALSTLRGAALPAVAALGGMLAPAGIYALIATDAGASHGWGVPMATDIAFAVGILTMLGRRVPESLRVLLLALAVIDDLGAIVVIALFYTSGLWLPGLAIAALGIVGLLAMQRVGVRTKLAYVAPALVVWAGVYAAGIHPTIAGVIIGLLTPVRAWLGPSGFEHELHAGLDALTGQASPTLERTLSRIDAARRETLSPAEGLIHALHPWVAFGIMPIFALANAGVNLSGTGSELLGAQAFWGAALGLTLGKPIGVLAACWLAQRSRLADVPRELGLRHLVLLGLVAGVGFTMALFIAALAFSDADHLAAAKLGVLAASAVAGVAAYAFGRSALR